MEKANRRVICFVMIALSFTLIACAKKEEDFDATGYVKASLELFFMKSMQNMPSSLTHLKWVWFFLRQSAT